MSYIKVNNVWHKTSEEKDLDGIKASLLDCTYQAVTGPRVNRKDDAGDACPLCTQNKKASDALKSKLNKNR